MFISKQKKTEIKHKVWGLVIDLDLSSRKYQKTCNNKEFIVSKLLDKVDNIHDIIDSVVYIGTIEFEIYFESIKKITSMLDRNERLFSTDNEEKYYNRRIKKILIKELVVTGYLLKELTYIKYTFPFFNDSHILFSLILQEAKRRKRVDDLMNVYLRKKIKLVSINS
jgi:hypothetical protein